MPTRSKPKRIPLVLFSPKVIFPLMSPRKSVSGGRLKLRAEATVSCCSCRSSIWVRYCNCLYKGSPSNLIASNGCNAEALFLVKVIP